MSDFDDRARAAAERVRRDAATIAADSESGAPPSRPTARGDHGDRRWLLVAASVAVVGAGIVGLVVVRDNGTTDRTDGPVGSDARDTVAVTEAPSVATSAPDTVAPTTPPTTPDTTVALPDPAIESITQPIVDPSVCEPVTAIDGSRSGLPRDPGSSIPLSLFARPSEFPIPIQVIAEEVDGPARPFAMVLRYLDSDLPPNGTESVMINGSDVAIGVFPNGNGQAAWNLPDGSQGYLRSRGLDREQLIAIVSALTPRPADAAIPGFDYGDGGPDGLGLVVEQMNTDAFTGSYAGSTCQLTPNLGYRVTAHRGDDFYKYATVIDRGPPLEVGVIGDTVITICCAADPAAPTVADVIQADDEMWRQLLLAADPIEGPYGQSISADLAVVEELVPIMDPSTPVSSVSMRRVVQDGVAFLEVDTSSAVLSELSEYWKIEIDGRISLRTTARAGGVLGVRLGGATSTAPFTVTVSTTDGDDFTIQTTAQILLLPPTS